MWNIPKNNSYYWIVENFVAKEEITHYVEFFLLPQYFQKVSKYGNRFKAIWQNRNSTGKKYLFITQLPNKNHKIWDWLWFLCLKSLNKSLGTKAFFENVIIPNLDMTFTWQPFWFGWGIYTRDHNMSTSTSPFIYEKHGHTIHWNDKSITVLIYSLPIRFEAPAAEECWRHYCKRMNCAWRAISPFATTFQVNSIIKLVYTDFQYFCLHVFKVVFCSFVVCRKGIYNYKIITKEKTTKGCVSLSWYKTKHSCSLLFVVKLIWLEKADIRL